MLGVKPLLGALVPGHRDQPVQVGPDHARLGGLLAHPLEASELLLGLLAHGLGHLGLFDLGAVLLDHRGVVLVELLTDRVHLLAQEVLALLLLGAGLDVVADALTDLQLGKPLALEGQRQLQPLGDVERLQQLHLLLVGQVGGVAAGVGQRSGLGDAPDERRHTAVVAAQLEDLLDQGAVLTLQVAGATVDGNVVDALLDLDVQPAVRHRVRRAGDPTVKALQRDGATATGQADAVGGLGDGTDAGVLAFVMGDEQHTVVLAGVHRQRQRHAREDDDVV